MVEGAFEKIHELVRESFWCKIMHRPFSPGVAHLRAAFVVLQEFVKGVSKGNRSSIDNRWSAIVIETGGVWVRV